MFTVQTPPSSSQPPSTTTPHPPIDHTTLLNAFIDASRPLNDIATDLKTTVRSIADWVATPDTQADLERLEAVALARTRLLAALHLPAAVATLAALASEAASSAFNSDASPATQARAREIARKASTTIVRFARAPHPNLSANFQAASHAHRPHRERALDPTHFLQSPAQSPHLPTTRSPAIAQQGLGRARLFPRTLFAPPPIRTPSVKPSARPTPSHATDFLVPLA